MKRLTDNQFREKIVMVLSSLLSFVNFPQSGIPYVQKEYVRMEEAVHTWTKPTTGVNVSMDPVEHIVKVNLF